MRVERISHRLHRYHRFLISQIFYDRKAHCRLRIQFSAHFIYPATDLLHLEPPAFTVLTNVNLLESKSVIRTEGKSADFACRQVRISRKPPTFERQRVVGGNADSTQCVPRGTLLFHLTQRVIAIVHPAAYLPARHPIIVTYHRQGAFAPKSVAYESNVPAGTSSYSFHCQPVLFQQGHASTSSHPNYCHSALFQQDIRSQITQTPHPQPPAVSVLTDVNVFKTDANIKICEMKKICEICGR